MLVTAKNRVAVRIGGKEYTLIGLESDDYIQKVASYIDKKLVEVQKKNPKLNSSMIAVLTAVNVADEFFKAVETEVAATEKLDKNMDEIDKLKLQLAQLTREVDLLNDKNSSLAKEVARKDMEFCEYKSSYERLPKVKFYSK